MGVDDAIPLAPRPPLGTPIPNIGLANSKRIFYFEPAETAAATAPIRLAAR